MFDVLGRFLVLFIYGYEYIKKVVFCMLLGGIEKVLVNGFRIRGYVSLWLIVYIELFFLLIV